MFRMLNINLSDEFLFLEKQTNKHQGTKNLFRTLTESELGKRGYTVVHFGR